MDIPTVNFYFVFFIFLASEDRAPNEQLVLSNRVVVSDALLSTFILFLRSIVVRINESISILHVKNDILSGIRTYLYSFAEQVQDQEVIRCAV